jgi:hypothetical protein
MKQTLQRPWGFGPVEAVLCLRLRELSGLSEGCDKMRVSLSFHAIIYTLSTKKEKTPEVGAFPSVTHHLKKSDRNLCGVWFITDIEFEFPPRHRGAPVSEFRRSTDIVFDDDGDCDIAHLHHCNQPSTRQPLTYRQRRDDQHSNDSQ